MPSTTATRVSSSESDTPASASGDRFQLIVKSASTAAPTLAEEVAKGLGAPDKSLPCRFLYDEVGSRIFDEICGLSEYYLTRAERSILLERADEIVKSVESPATLIELGSGSAEKTRLIIEAMLANQRSLDFMPIDIARSVLEESAVSLLDDYSRLEIKAIASEYGDAFQHLSAPHVRPRLILWLGSSVGNFRKSEAAEFLTGMGSWMSSQDRMLIGIDLRKDAGRLERAYDDSQGVTARFNKNLLTRINRELGANFEVDRFSFEARYCESTGSVESYLVSDTEQDVTIGALETTFHFGAGERIHTEDSHKFSHDEIDALAEASGMRRESYWMDDEGLFSLNLFSRLSS
jgi:L-histidine N-alpha-methyltransferase